ncbi:hypothetical protein ACQWFR_24325, partial [Salmonella enterica subsp. enterica serovar Infantis]
PPVPTPISPASAPDHTQSTIMTTLQVKTHYFVVLFFLFLAKQVAAASFCNNTPRNFILRQDILFNNLDVPADASSYPLQIGRRSYYSENVLFDY